MIEDQGDVEDLGVLQVRICVLDVDAPIMI